VVDLVEIAQLHRLASVPAATSGRRLAVEESEVDKEVLVGEREAKGVRGHETEHRLA
jgi:hypothetical protein